MKATHLFGRRLLGVAYLSAAMVLSGASIIDTGVRTAEIGRLVEECCECLSSQDCLQEGTTEEECRSAYNPIEAMTNQLEIPTKEAGCEQICQDCRELQDQYDVEFGTATPHLGIDMLRPPAISITAYAKTVEYEFRDLSCAREFASLNRSTED